ncbi:MAG: class I SAM-dependent methyltransferase [Planctomycetota bacterium]
MPLETPPQVAVFAASATLAVQSRADVLSAALDLPRVETPDCGFELLLTVTESRLELRLNRPDAPGPVFVDFLKGALGYMRRINPFGRLIQAVCPGKGTTSVLDATAGLGHDAFILAHKGCLVRAVERSPVLAALVQDGMDRAALDPELERLFSERFSLVCADARDLLAGLEADRAPDVVYLDPMFPAKKKSALVKKEMRIVRCLVGDDHDSEALLHAARERARHGVIVKRMLQAPAIAPDISRSYKGKTTRYDLYSPYRGS